MIRHLIWLPVLVGIALAAAMSMMAALFSDEPQAALFAAMMGLLRYQPAWLFYSVVAAALALVFAAVAGLSEYQNRTRESAHSSSVRDLRAEISRYRAEVIELKTELHMTQRDLNTAKSELLEREALDAAQMSLLNTRKLRIKNALLRSK